MKKTKKKESVKKNNLMSMKEYAKRKEVSYEIIRKYCQQGRLTKDKNGKLDPEVADKELSDNVAINGNAKLVEKKPKKPITDINHTVEYNKAKARREKSKADLAELEYKIKAGLVIEVAVVEREAEDVYRVFRDQMLNVIIRASKKLLGETNEFKFRRVLKTEIENAIQRVK